MTVRLIVDVIREVDNTVFSAVVSFGESYSFGRVWLPSWLVGRSPAVNRQTETAEQKEKEGGGHLYNTYRKDDGLKCDV